MAPVAYDLAVASWRQSPVVCIVSVTGGAIAYFPLDFVRHGGHPEWSYILLALEQITYRALEERWWLQCPDGTPVSLPECPSAGTFVYRCQGRRGSSYKTRRLNQYLLAARNISNAFNHRLQAVVSRLGQILGAPALVKLSSFRVDVIARDSICLVTDVPHQKCTAAHIVPYSRPDVYMQVLNIPYEPPMFHTSCGLLLRDEWHHSFDRLEWSLYHKDGIFYVHCFTSIQSDAATYHGKALLPERFRGLEEVRPDVRLVQWHYRQCLMAHVRGFAVGMD